MRLATKLTLREADATSHIETMVVSEQSEVGDRVGKVGGWMKTLWLRRDNGFMPLHIKFIGVVKPFNFIPLIIYKDTTMQNITPISCDAAHNLKILWII